MKIKTTIVMGFLILASCRDNPDTSRPDAINLLSFYKDTSFSEFFVFPDTTHVDSLFFFSGREIDSVTFRLLPELVTRKMSAREGFFGVFAFDFNKDYKGLITRIPGAYSPTAISLLIYDCKNESVISSVLLADTWGDAGDSETRNSLIFFDKEKHLHAFTLVNYTHDHSLDDVEQPDSTVEVNHYYYLTRINTRSIDTLSKDSTILKERFRTQLNRMAFY